MYTAGDFLAGYQVPSQRAERFDCRPEAFHHTVGQERRVGVALSSYMPRKCPKKRASLQTKTTRTSWQIWGFSGGRLSTESDVYSLRISLILSVVLGLAAFTTQ